MMGDIAGDRWTPTAGPSVGNPDSPVPGRLDLAGLDLTLERSQDGVATHRSYFSLVSDTLCSVA